MAADAQVVISVLPKSRGSVDFTTSQLDINLKIIDPCEPYSPATLTREEVPQVNYILSQASVTIATEWTLTPAVDTITAADCKGLLEATIPAAIGTDPVDAAMRVSFSTDTTAITVPVSTDPTMAGTHDIVIKYKSRAGTDWNKDLTVRLVIIDPCEPTDMTVVATTPATAATYVFNEATTKETFTWEVTPLVTETSIEDCAVTWRMDAPAAITTDAAALAVTHTATCTTAQCTSDLDLPVTTSVPMAGVHTITITPVSRGGNDVTAGAITYTLTIKDWCEPDIVLPVLTPSGTFSHNQGDAPETWDVSGQWTQGGTHPADPACAFTYQVSGIPTALSTVITFADATGIFTIDTNTTPNPADAGTWTGI